MLVVFCCFSIPTQPLPPAGHENVAHFGPVFVSGYILSPPEHQHAHLGALVVFGRFSTARHAKMSHMGCVFMSGYLPVASPPEYHQHTQMGTLVVFRWGGKVAGHKNTSPMGCLCMSGCGEPTEDHQCTQMGMLVF